MTAKWQVGSDLLFPPLCVPEAGGSDPPPQPYLLGLSSSLLHSTNPSRSTRSTSSEPQPGFSRIEPPLNPDQAPSSRQPLHTNLGISPWVCITLVVPAVT